MHKNDQPSKRDRFYRLLVRESDNQTSQVLEGTWLPALNCRCRTRRKEFKRMWRNTKQ